MYEAKDCFSAFYPRHGQSPHQTKHRLSRKDKYQGLKKYYLEVMKSLKRFSLLASGVALGIMAVLLLGAIASRYTALQRNTNSTGEHLGKKLAQSIPQERVAPLPSESWRVVKVSDGDTITVVRGSQKEKIRFCGIDANESKQEGGREATSYLRSLIDKGNGTVTISPIEKDRYGRTVAELFVKPRPGTPGYQPEEEIFLNGEMVRAGFGRVYPAFVTNCPNKEVLEQAEEMAKAQRVGVWGNSSSIPPWEWRKQQRQNRAVLRGH